MKDRPCLSCTKETGRYPGCHSRCDAYILYKKKMEERKAVINKARDDLYGQRPSKFKQKYYRRSKHGEV